MPPPTAFWFKFNGVNRHELVVPHVLVKRSIG